jgi:FMN phosphatase YigB (HAD superfamily)
MGIVLLDIGNVIVDVDFLRFCMSVSPDGESGAEKLFLRYCASEEKNRFDRGLAAPGEFISGMARDPDIKLMPTFELKMSWQDIFSLKEGSSDAVDQIRQKHRVWIMSDTDPLHFAFLINSFKVLKLAERYFLSYEHGWLKRQPQAFREVLAAAKGKPASDFILLDDRQENCRSAESCGIRAHRFTTWPRALDAVREWES